MAHRNNDTLIWQWNCRGYLRKQPVIRQHLRTLTRQPDVIMIQETHIDSVTLPGYQPFIPSHAARRLCTFVRKRITATEHNLNVRNIEHLFVELIPTRKRKESIFLLNVYSHPSAKVRSRFLTLFKKALNVAGTNPLVIGGDFNLPHPAWGYGYSTTAAQNLWQDSQDLGLTFITDPTFPTRLGNSTSRDTTPDLTFTKNVINAQWSNTQHDLGSDHSIIAILIPRIAAVTAKPLEFSWVDWDAFRKHRSADQHAERITDIDAWSRNLQSDTKAATHTVTTDAPVERMDSRLAHLLAAKTSILSRWKGQRLNRRLRAKIALLNKEIEAHCLTLSRQQWTELCNHADGKIHCPSSWKLLKHLLDSQATRSSQQDRLTKLLYTETKKQGRARVLDHLTNKYLPMGPVQPHGSYTGAPNPHWTKTLVSLRSKPPCTN